MHYEIKQVYEFYKQAEAKKLGKKHVKTKNFEKRFMEVMSSDTQDILIEITDKFNKEWSMVKPLQYFTIAFTIKKTWQYKDLLDDRIIRKYVKVEVKEREKKNKSFNTFFKIEELKIEDVIEVPKEVKKEYDNIDDIMETYVQYRRAQAFINNRGYRIPKDFEKHFNTKLTEKNREILSMVTKYFMTRWSGIDAYEYFVCGFTIFKGFTYHQFFDRKVMTMYVTKDRNKKRSLKLVHEKMEESKKFVLDYIKENGLKSVKEYGDLRKQSELVCIHHYLHNRICKFLLVSFISKGVVKLNDDDRTKIPYIVTQYREILAELEEFRNGKKL